MLHYVLEDRWPVWLVRFETDLAGQEDRELRRLFVDLVKESKTKVVMDMAKVRFIDSVILGTLVWGMKNLREAGGDARLFALTDFVRNLFEITQLNRAFKIYPDQEQAEKSFA